jgi:hypothetical protein
MYRNIALIKGNAKAITERSKSIRPLFPPEVNTYATSVKTMKPAAIATIMNIM